MTATSSSGFVSEIAMAARRPAAPPPIRSTSCDAIGSSLTSQLLVDQDSAAVVHHPEMDAPVVELFLGAPAAAAEADVLGGEPLQVLGVAALTVVRAAAGREQREEWGGAAGGGGGGAGAAPPPALPFVSLYAPPPPRAPGGGGGDAT